MKRSKTNLKPIMGKKSKTQATQEALDTEADGRRDAFMEEYRKLVAEHQVDVAATLDIKAGGIVPRVVLIDLKERNQQPVEPKLIGDEPEETKD